MFKRWRINKKDTNRGINAINDTQTKKDCIFFRTFLKKKWNIGQELF